MNDAVMLGLLDRLAELAETGFAASERRVLAGCSEIGIFSAFVKRRQGKGGIVGPPVCDDLVRREFAAFDRDRLWLTDITEHPTSEGKVYLCAVKDVWSNRIVGYSIDARMTSELAVAALRMAVQRRTPRLGTVVHSNRGSQFRSRRFQSELDRQGLVGSMGQIGAAGDNAAMESFFALLQKNLLNSRHWTTRDELHLAMVIWIERTYHHRRRQRGLGKLTPTEFDTIMTTRAESTA